MIPLKIYILSGGAGTRLWPFSREQHPKQFLDLIKTGKPLLVDTLERLKPLGTLSIVTNKSLTSGTTSLLKNFKIEAEVLSEPSIRNTAAAVYWASLQATQKDPTAIVGIFPADHHIKNTAQFHAAVKKAINIAQSGRVVTLGIQPTYPSTAYGYIQLTQAPQFNNDLVEVSVDRFLEKPSETRAQELIATQRVVWNAGIFIFQAKKMLDLFVSNSPEIATAFAKLKADGSNIDDVYKTVKAEAIDTAIMEKLSDLACVPVEMGWSDIGSWEEVAKLSPADKQTIEVNGTGNFYTSLGESKAVAFLGVDDLMVANTPDALVIAKKGSGQNVRAIVDAVKAKLGSALILAHTFEERPWGRFEILRDEKEFKSKKITVFPGQRLSYQSHKHRSEHWIVVTGRAEVILNDSKHLLNSGDHIFIPQGAKHRICNLGSVNLEFIEVQTGSYFGEDDIVRYGDDYGRV
jgi:mannose-1-phosphate guanylyltransferase/mannose-6-phosphate isomerase